LSTTRSIRDLKNGIARNVVKNKASVILVGICGIGRMNNEEKKQDA
jgi:hypothetical protein